MHGACDSERGRIPSQEQTGDDDPEAGLGHRLPSVASSIVRSDTETEELALTIRRVKFFMKVCYREGQFKVIALMPTHLESIRNVVNSCW